VGDKKRKAGVSLLLWFEIVVCETNRLFLGVSLEADSPRRGTGLSSEFL
jgi:hypothetical protein